MSYNPALSLWKNKMFDWVASRVCYYLFFISTYTTVKAKSLWATLHEKELICQLNKVSLELFLVGFLVLGFQAIVEWNSFLTFRRHGWLASSDDFRSIIHRTKIYHKWFLASGNNIVNFWAFLSNYNYLSSCWWMSLA